MRRDRPFTCELTAEAVHVLVGSDGHGLPARLEGHLSTCLRCQAEMARARRTFRTLRSLGSDALAPPAGAVTATIAALHEVPPGRSPHMTVATAAGAAGAAAGMAGMFVWRTKRRSLAG